MQSISTRNERVGLSLKHPGEFFTNLMYLLILRTYFKIPQPRKPCNTIVFNEQSRIGRPMTGGSYTTKGKAKHLAGQAMITWVPACFSSATRSVEA